jgi:hypothetical protein
MDKVQKLNNSECYTPSSEPIRIYLELNYLCIYLTTMSGKSFGPQRQIELLNV